MRNEAREQRRQRSDAQRRVGITPAQCLEYMGYPPEAWATLKGGETHA